jgi:CBS domain-containing protein
MTANLEDFIVADAMVEPVIAVPVQQTIDQVAQLFDQQRIHAAPVVDAEGVCVGIITSSDVIKFEAVREERENLLQHGAEFDRARYDNPGLVQAEESGSREIGPTLSEAFAQVNYHMTRDFQTVTEGTSLALAAEQMWSQSLHHLLILDDLRRPRAILSALDILRFLTPAGAED